MEIVQGQEFLIDNPEDNTKGLGLMLGILKEFPTGEVSYWYHANGILPQGRAIILKEDGRFVMYHLDPNEFEYITPVKSDWLRTELSKGPITTIQGWTITFKFLNKSIVTTTNFNGRSMFVGMKDKDSDEVD